MSLEAAIHCLLRIGSSGFVFLSSFFCNNSCCYDSFDNCGADDGGRCTFCSWDSSSYCWRLKPLPHRPRQATLGGVYHRVSYCCFVHSAKKSWYTYYFLYLSYPLSFLEHNPPILEKEMHCVCFLSNCTYLVWKCLWYMDTAALKSHTPYLIGLCVNPVSWGQL